MGEATHTLGLPAIEGSVRLTYDTSTDTVQGTATLTVPYGTRTVSQTYPIEVPDEFHKLCADMMDEAIAAHTMEMYAVMMEAMAIVVRLGETA